MQHRPFGKLGLEVSILELGAPFISEGDSLPRVHQARNAGMHLRTASPAVNTPLPPLLLTAARQLTRPAASPHPEEGS